MVISDWEKEIDKTSAEGRKEYAEAIRKLLGWDKFRDEYGWTGLGVIEAILNYKCMRHKD